MSQPERIEIGDLDIDLSAYRITRNGKSIRLTPTEWSLLTELIRHKNQVLSHETLLKRVWGDEYRTESDYVHTYISRLRRKLEENPAEPQYILTEPGIGYRLQREGSKRLIDAPGINTPTKIKRLTVINPFPQLIDSRYVGRDKEQADLVHLLEEKARLISIYGRGGIGKTALVCKVLNDILSSDLSTRFDGMILLSATSTGINLLRILTDFKKLLEDTEWMPETLLGDKSHIAQQITALLDAINGGNYILLLDNLETYQTATGELEDEALELLLRMTLQQSSSLRIIVTSREPVALPRAAKVWERIIPLERGLSPTEGAQLLSNCDPDGSAGLRDANSQLLHEISQRTGGYPRALEAAAGFLLENPILTPQALIDDQGLLAGEVNESVVHSILSQLDPTWLRVMEIVAAFEQPITAEMISDAANAYLAPTQVRTILNRLVRSFFLRYNPATGRLSTHAIDLAYCYSRIPQNAQENPDYYLAKVHREISRVYRKHQTDEIQSEHVDALYYHLREIDHLIYAGDYSEAAQLLIDLDLRYLSRWGYYAALNERYLKLIDKVDDARWSRQILLRTGESYQGIGRFHEAEACYQKAYQIAILTDETGDLALAANNLAWIKYDLGLFSDAQNYFQEAIRQFERVQDIAGIANAQGGLGWVSYLRGDYDAAAANFEQALTIFQQIGDEYGYAVNVGDLGVVRMAQKNYNEAIRLLHESLIIADKNHAQRETSYKGSYLATAYLLSGDLESAERVIRQISQNEEVPVNQPSVLALQGVIFTRLGRPSEEVFIQAIQTADQLLEFTPGLYRVRYARGLANAGLALTQPAALENAQKDYAAAVTICNQAGVVGAHRSLLESLTIDQPSLTELKQLLS